VLLKPSKLPHTGEFIEPLLPTLAYRADIPLHVQHMSERLGQLVMLHLGEVVIGIAATPLEATVPQFIAVALAATLVWSLHLTYYHVEPDEHSHAYRQSRLRGLLYFYCHWLLAVALLLTGSSLRLLLGEWRLAKPPGGPPEDGTWEPMQQ
jgi:low temperature requirement protein LtrA